MLITPITADQTALAPVPYVEERQIEPSDQLKLLSDELLVAQLMDATSTLLERYFGDKWQIFEKIAACESGAMQFYPDGRTVTSPKNRDGTHDHGYLQINDKNITEAYTLGLDVLGNLEDNIHMAGIVFNRQGYGAWKTCARKNGVVIPTY